MMSAPHFETDQVAIYEGDCIDVMRELPDASVDAVCTDPPYGLGFMGKEWDDASRMTSFTEANTRLDKYPKTGKGPAAVAFDGRAFQAWCEQWATEALRVLKPGGHLLAFGGTRTFHRLTAGIEDAGFEIRDSIAWLYGSGFPKSLDVSKAIDSRKDWAALQKLQMKVRAARLALGLTQSEAARRVGLIGPEETLGGGGFMWFETGMRLPTREQYPALKLALGLDDECDQAFEAAEREVIGQHSSGITRGTSGAGGGGEGGDRTAPATPEAVKWQGWGTALKPAFEPIVVARKPLTGTVAANVLAWGTGALNIDSTRIGTDEDRSRPPRTPNAILGGGKGTNLLEPFAGSGTTVEAAVLEGFRCIAIEREADYLPLIMQRVSKPHAVGLDLDDWQPDPAARLGPVLPASVVEAPVVALQPRLAFDFVEAVAFDFGDWELDA